MFITTKEWTLEIHFIQYFELLICVYFLWMLPNIETESSSVCVRGITDFSSDTESPLSFLTLTLNDLVLFLQGHDFHLPYPFPLPKMYQIFQFFPLFFSSKICLLRTLYKPV